MSLDVDGVKLLPAVELVKATMDAKRIVRGAYPSADSSALQDDAPRITVTAPVFDEAGAVVGVLQAISLPSIDSPFLPSDEAVIQDLCALTLSLVVAALRVDALFRSESFSNISSVESDTKGSSTIFSHQIDTTASTLRPTTRKLHVLIVDDSKSNRKILRHTLEKQFGHTAVEATDGAEALRLVAQSFTSKTKSKSRRAFDFIFMDFVMPVMDGPTSAREILAIGYPGQIVGVTSADYVDVEAFMASGVSTVLEKPIKAGMLEKIFSGEKFYLVLLSAF